MYQGSIHMIKNFTLIYPLTLYASSCIFDVLRTLRSLCAPSLVQVRDLAEPMTHEAFQTYVNDNFLFIKSPSIFNQQLLKTLFGSWAWEGLSERCTDEDQDAYACVQTIPAAAEIFKNRVALMFTRITAATVLLFTSVAFVMPIRRDSKLYRSAAAMPVRPFVRFRDALSKPSFAMGRCFGAAIVSTALIGVIKTTFVIVWNLTMYWYSQARASALVKPVTNLGQEHLLSLGALKAWMQDNHEITETWSQNTISVVDRVNSDSIKLIPALKTSARLLVHSHICKEFPPSSLIPRLLNTLASRHADRAATTSLVAITAFPRGIDVASAWMAPWLRKATSRAQANTKAVIIALIAVVATGYCMCVLLLMDMVSYIFRWILCGVAGTLLMPTGVLSSAGYVLQELACAGHTHEFVTSACQGSSFSHTSATYAIAALTVCGALAVSSVLFTYQEHYDPKGNANTMESAVIKLKVMGMFVALFVFTLGVFITTKGTVP